MHRWQQWDDENAAPSCDTCGAASDEPCEPECQNYKESD